MIIFLRMKGLAMLPDRVLHLPGGDGGAMLLFVQDRDFHFAPADIDWSRKYLKAPSEILPMCLIFSIMRSLK
jgi:hypothetical protein